MDKRYEWDLKGTKKLPVELTNTRNIRLGAKFTIKAVARVNYTAERHTIFSKRALETFGNRPGVILQIHNSRIEFLTFGDGDKTWHILTTDYHILKAGQNYEILAWRNAERNKGGIYVDGISRTATTSHIVADDKRFLPGVSVKDVNCDESIIIGAQLMNWRAKEGRKPFCKLRGQIQYVQLITKIELPNKLLGYPAEKTWMPLQEYALRTKKPKKLTFTP